MNYIFEWSFKFKVEDHYLSGSKESREREIIYSSFQIAQLNLKDQTIT
jgi:hypothetical protein